MKEYNVCVQTFMMLIMMTLMYVWFKLLNNFIFIMGWGCAKTMKNSQELSVVMRIFFTFDELGVWGPK